MNPVSTGGLGIGSLPHRRGDGRLFTPVSLVQPFPTLIGQHPVVQAMRCIRPITDRAEGHAVKHQ